MSLNSVNRKVRQSATAWDVLIAHAKAQLRKVKEREEGLLIVIARFEKFRDDGNPFPVELSFAETAALKVESIPA